MKTETQELIRFKSTKVVSMDYIPGGDILLTVEGDPNDNVTPMYVVEIPKRQVYPILRGLISYIQRFYQKHGKKKR